MEACRSAGTEIQFLLDAAKASRIRKVVSCLASATLRDPLAVGDIELAIGEAFSNAVKYGLGGKASMRIDISEPENIAVEMTYPGKGFDTTVTYPDDAESGDGGFGRYIMHQILDKMDYYFEDGCTILSISKHRP